MLAMVVRETRPIEENPLVLEETPTPNIAGDEMLLKVRACGICHTDLHIAEGDLTLPKLPLIPGHQVVGTVVTPSASGCFAAGDRVGVTWFSSSCGVCGYCTSGRENLCSDAQFTGLHRDGGFAEYMVVKEMSAFAIPPNFSDAEATPLLCGGVIGYRALKLSKAAPGGTLGLYGFGNSAHLVIQIAVNMGCRVHVFTRSRKHRDLAEDLGAVWVGTADGTPPHPMDSSIIFAPAGELIPKALRVLSKGGVLTLAGITMSRIPEMPYDLLYHERCINSVANTTRQDASELLMIVGTIPVRTVVEQFALGQANEALTLMKTSYLDAGAALIP